MKKLINIALIAFVSLAYVGCNEYNNYTDPDVAHVYTDEDFADYQILSIREFKDKYSSLVGTSKSEQITEDWVIRGKVISSDETGNVYKSLYIQDDDQEDGRAAIELRLYASNYTAYPMGYMVYVKLKDLSIGDYSGMISVGARSTDSTSDYVHTTLENHAMVIQHIFLGQSGEITEDDILVINEDNYDTFDYDSHLACLIRIENVVSTFGTSAWGYKNTYPNYFNASSNLFTWDESLGEEDEVWVNPPLAYKGVNPFDATTGSEYFYGSSWYTYNSSSSSSIGSFVIRLSAYARFKDREIPAHGTRVNITSILTQYSSTYQVVPCFSEDIEELE